VVILLDILVYSHTVGQFKTLLWYVKLTTAISVAEDGTEKLQQSGGKPSVFRKLFYHQQSSSLMKHIGERLPHLTGWLSDSLFLQQIRYSLMSVD
jgi:hypothetical protein